jgi:predicted PurR-regulated permease PerM
MLGKQSSSQSKQQFGFYFLLLFGLFLFVMLYDYFTAFLGAVIFYLLFKNFMAYLVEKKKWRASRAALLLMILSLLIVVIPGILIVNLLYNKIAEVVSNPTSLINAFHTFDDQLKEFIGQDIFSPEQINQIKEKLAGLLPALLNKLLGTLSTLAIMYFILYFMLVSYQEMSDFLIDFLPFEPGVTHLFQKELYDMTVSNAITTPLLAGIQGISGGLAFYFLGIPDAAFWGSMCGIFSFIPIVGSAMIWLPATLYLYVMGQHLQSYILLAYGVLIISNIDNVIRMVLQKKFADVHPVISIFGVLIGLNLFGITGLIFGPLLISFFVLGVKIYRRNYVKKLEIKQEENIQQEEICEQ